jgi:hypothetical protein
VVNDRFDVDELIGLLSQVVVTDKEGKAEMASAADQLLERGRREGIQLGRREMLLEQLRTRFGELPEAATARVNAADAAQINLWAKRVLTAPTLADVLESD